MTEFQASSKSLVTFLNGFGKKLEDIAIRAKGGYIEAAVGNSTHYMRRRLSCDVVKSGNLFISDLTKFKGFLSANKNGTMKVSQSGKTGTLHVNCDKSSLQLLTTSYIQSQADVPLIEKLVSRSEDNMWQTWANFNLDYHAKVEGEDFIPATQFSKVVGNKFNCRTEFDPHGQEYVIRAGSRNKGKMFVKVSLVDIDSPDIPARSAFAHWLPDLLSNMPAGPIDLHTGDETVLVLKQPDSGYLLVVMDQEYEED